MELKFVYVLPLSSLNPSSNRTFMELKFPQERNESICSGVLIVPLWN